MGFKVNEVYTSGKYLKSSDLEGQMVTATIKDVTKELLGDQEKLVIYFEGKQKGLALNKTNANEIALARGMDSDNWPGTKLQIFSMMVNFQGTQMEGLRVKVIQDKKSPPSKFKQQGFSDTGPTRTRREPDDPRTMMDNNDQDDNDAPF